MIVLVNFPNQEKSINPSRIKIASGWKIAVFGSEPVRSDEIIRLNVIKPNAIKPEVEARLAEIIGSIPVITSKIIARNVPGSEPKAFHKDFW